MTRDPYAVLGVEPTASDREIRAAYRRRAKATHPDRDGRSEEFIALTEAYETLIDPARRARLGRRQAAPSETAATGPIWVAPEESAAPRRGPVAARASYYAGRTDWRWFVAAVAGTLGVIALTSWGRGAGWLPHHHLGPGEHLILGNFVSTGWWQAGVTSLHHGFVVLTLAVALAYAMVICAGWVLRPSLARPTRGYELAAFLVVTAGTFTVREDVAPSSLVFGLWVVLNAVWLAWARREDAAAPRRR